MTENDNMVDASVTITFIIPEICFDSEKDDQQTFEEYVMDRLQQETFDTLIGEDYHIEKIQAIS